jgi:hypothetical protein
VKSGLGLQRRDQTFDRCATMAVKLAQINLTHLVAGRALEPQPRAFRGVVAPIVG